MAQIIHNVSAPDDGLGDALRTGFVNQNLMNTELYASVVFKVAGYGLSQNDFTDDYVTKLEALNLNAEENVQADWNELDPTSDAYIKGKPVFQSSNIIVSAIWTGVGFGFDVIADAFPINSVLYPATPNLVTLADPDPTVDIDRIDLIVAIIPIAPATVGTVGKITGTPASPELVVPPDYDPSIYYVIKQITVKGASAQPDGVENTTVFDETGGIEWTPTLTANLAITNTDPSSGAVSLEAVNNIDTDSALFEALASMSTADVDLMTFDLKLKEAVLGKFIYIEFLLNGVLAFSYSFNSPNNLFDDSNLSYQNISITKSNFNAPIVDFNQIKIRPFWNSTGYFLDNIKIFKGSGSETLPDTGIPDAPADGNMYGRKNGSWEVSTSTKELFTATAGQTNFVLNSIPDNVDVILDRVPQIETIDYNLVDGTVIMTNPVDLGSKLEVRKYK